ncbi:MAG: hypothetical protein ACOC3D_09595 [Pseudomonadota bacterium]
MDSLLEERIRQRAFELSEDPTRADLSAIDHWLDAERLIMGGLAEDDTTYEAASDQTIIETTSKDDTTKRTTTETDRRRAGSTLRRGS